MTTPNSPTKRNLRNLPLGNIFRSVFVLLSSGLIYSLSYFALTVLINRVSGATEAGYFFQAAAIANIFFQFSAMGLSVLILTDATRRFSYSDYLSFQITVSTLAMVGVLGITLFYTDKYLVLILLLASVQRFLSNVLTTGTGIFQREEMLRVIFRQGLLMSTLPLALAALYYFSGIFGTSVAGVNVLLNISFFATAAFIMLPGFRRIGIGRLRFSPSVSLQIFRIAMPLGVASVSVVLIAEVPKIVLAHYHPLSYVAYYSTIAYFFIVPKIISEAITNSLYKHMASLSNSGRHWLSLRLALANATAMVAATMIMLLAAIMLGNAVITAIFTAEYGNYSYVLPMVMVASVFMGIDRAFASYIMAEQAYRLQYLRDAVAVATVVVASFIFIPSMGVFGAGVTLIAASIAPSVFSIIAALTLATKRNSRVRPCTRC